MNENRKVATTTGGAIGISAVTSFIGLCCVGPWAVSLFGVSGAVAMARWSPISPYMLVVAGGMLAWAFWRVYHPRPSCAGTICSPSIWTRVMLWVAAVMVVMALFAEQLQWLLIDPTPEGLRE